MSDKGSFLAGFLLGGLTGAVAALLMAPQPGEQTLTQVQERGIELKARLKDLSTQAKEQVDQTKEQLQERGAGLKTQLEDLTVEARKRAETVTAKIQEQRRAVVGEEPIEIPTDEESD